MAAEGRDEADTGSNGRHFAARPSDRRSELADHRGGAEEIGAYLYLIGSPATPRC